FLWLIAYRLLGWWRDASELPTLSLLALAIAVSVTTFAGEAAGIAIAFHVSPLRVLETIFDFDAGIRPGWLVLAAGLAVVATDAVILRLGESHRGRACHRGRIEFRQILRLSSARCGSGGRVGHPARTICAPAEDSDRQPSSV